MSISFKSFVFLDLESTGLPFREPDGKRTRITEICMVSICKEHLLKCADEANNYCPRVIRKLTLPVNPGKVISEEASNLSRLDNFLLENEDPFNEKITAVISSFLNTCASPICLIAHNGYVFDFPLLKEELKKFSDVVIPPDVYCSDSKVAFRELSNIKELEKLAYNFSNATPVIPVSYSTSNPVSNERDRSPIRLSSEITDIDLAFNEVAQEIERLHSPRKGTNAIQHINETTPKSQPIIHSSSLPRTYSGECRRLFTGQTPDRKSLCGRNAFSLKNVYETLFGEEFPNQHEAESDVMAMVKCCAKYGKHVVDWFEKNHKLFSEINNLYK